MPAVRAPHQPSFADLGTPLHKVTFVIVDLETTGGSCHDCRITEFGAVKVRSGEILGEFQSLVDPGQRIPPSISALTGITDAMVSVRPPVEAVLPTFLEFCRGTTLVAHNAGFDISFLNAGLSRLDYPRLDNPVVCTAALARRLVRDEVRNCKLATLAQFFACRTTPIHRALADARATVEVFHGLLERAGSYGVLTLEDLVGFCKAGSAPLFASRRKLADGLPSKPGVYAFKSASGEVLYVGKATDLRSRVRSYFGNDERRKIAQMMKEVDAIDHWVSPTPIEAAVREVRLIERHRPRFNRRSKHPERRVHVRLTRERFPRLSVVKAAPADGSPSLGPLASRSVAETIVEAVQEAAPIRRCTPRIGAQTRFAPCALAAMGRCLSPCDASVTPEGYAGAVAVVAEAFNGDPAALAAVLSDRMLKLAGNGRFEEAATTRDRLRAIVTAVRTARHVKTLARAGLVVAARRVDAEHTEVAAIAGARLVASVMTPAAGAEAAGEQLRADLLSRLGAGAVETETEGSAEEHEVLARWLTQTGVRIHWCDGELASDVAGGSEVERLFRRLARVHRSTGRADAELAAKRRRREPAAVAETA
jgi:DNA polymerase III subunit epsilon